MANALADRRFDARPDRVDFRDRVYMPPLVALPAQWPEPAAFRKLVAAMAKQGLVLDQLKEGACTGFGLAGVINHMAWRRAAGGKDEVPSVSARMLYQLARQYDEWPGEDYDGSSCRGAMKGWHRHGVCSVDFWAYADKKGRFVKPSDGWEEDAATRPLGAYYRVDKASIADMQAAIHEVGAIYVSADVHAGWGIGTTKSLSLIPCQKDSSGGHAFALVGYEARGFILQNSWGPGWGYKGFAILGYDDWVLHGGDAWVAAMGAPMSRVSAERTFASQPLRDRQAAPGIALLSKAAAAVADPATLPWSESRAYEHSIVLGNNGVAQNRFIDVPDAATAVRRAAYDSPLAWLKAQPQPRLAIYAHGGLNDEAASIKRIRVMAPYFAANGIYPLFLTWRTGVLESLVGMLADTVAKLYGAELAAASGWEWAQDQADRAIEALAERALVKPIWVQIKQNAEAAAGEGAGLWQLAVQLRALRKALPKLQLHLVGHSAGSILLGHLLDLLAPAEAVAAVPLQGCSLLAPACTLGFANRHYGDAVAAGLFAAPALHVDLMSHKRELADTVGPYHKSLLFLVSRALESLHKMPLLGMEAAWHPGPGYDDAHLWNANAASVADLAQWRAFAGAGVVLKVHADKMVHTGTAQNQTIPLAHGSFDNDIGVITDLLRRILGAEPAVAVSNLQAF